GVRERRRRCRLSRRVGGIRSPVEFLKPVAESTHLRARTRRTAPIVESDNGCVRCNPVTRLLDSRAPNHTQVMLSRVRQIGVSDSATRLGGPNPVGAGLKSGWIHHFGAVLPG